MGIFRLNHAVLFVRDVERSVAFYSGVLGFERVDMTPEGFQAAFMRAPGSTNDHDLGLFQMAGAAKRRTRDEGEAERDDGAGTAAADSPAGRSTVGLYHLAWEVDTLRQMRELAGALTDAGALHGASDHGTTKSLYGKDPDGLEFEIVWLVPADLLDDATLESRKTIGPLDLDAEVARYGADRPGLSLSAPIMR